MTRARAVTLALVWFALGALARAAEVIPPAPRDHFNDYAGLVRRETATQLQSELAQFERDTSNQILVAIYPKLESASSVEDYAVRVAQAWRVGQKQRANGAVLFVFRDSRDVRIVTGYGLEAALPDALCKRIIEDEIIPRFRGGDFDAGLTAGVRAMIAAARGEYQGAGRLATDGRAAESGSNRFIFIIIVAVILLSALNRRSHRRTIYSRRGPRTTWIDHTGWGGGGGGFGGFGGGSSGGGGSFSGGGGSFGGGGAGGTW